MRRPINDDRKQLFRALIIQLDFHIKKETFKGSSYINQLIETTQRIVGGEEICLKYQPSVHFVRYVRERRSIGISKIDCSNITRETYITIMRWLEDALHISVEKRKKFSSEDLFD